MRRSECHCSCSRVVNERMTGARYLNVSLQLVTFATTRHHPDHVRQLVHSHITVLHLAQVIRAETGVATRRIDIYADRSPSADPLPDDQSLEQCGFVGGPRGAPNSLELYYDYSIDIGAGCPLIMCDHYFGQRRARLHRAGSGSALQVLVASAAAGSQSSAARVHSASSGSLLSVVDRRSQLSFISARPTSASHLTV